MKIKTDEKRFTHILRNAILSLAEEKGIDLEKLSDDEMSIWIDYVIEQIKQKREQQPAAATKPFVADFIEDTEAHPKNEL